MIKKTIGFFAFSALIVFGAGYAVPHMAAADTVSSNVVINPLNGGTENSTVSSSPINPLDGGAASNATSNAIVHSHPMSPIGAVTSDLAVGMTGTNVMVLQQYLNAQGFTVSASGAGSSGQETQYFGLATKTALIKFQAASGITPASGYFGPITRAYITQHTMAINTQGDQAVHVVYQGEYTCLLPVPTASGAVTADCALGLKTSGGLYYALNFTNAPAASMSLQGASQISVTGTLEGASAQNTALAQKYAIQGVILVDTATKI